MSTPAHAGEASELVPFRIGNAMLGISKAGAHRYRKNPASDLPRPFKRGQRWVYLRGDITGWIARKAAEANGHRLQRATGGLEAAQSGAASLAAVLGDGYAPR